MKKINISKDLSINESEVELCDGGKGLLVVIMYSGSSEPRIMLDWAVREYVGGQEYSEFIDSHLDNPWCRVVIIGINE